MKKMKLLHRLFMILALSIVLGVGLQTQTAFAASSDEINTKIISGSENGKALSYVCPGQTVYLMEKEVEAFAESSDEAMEAYLAGEIQVQWFKEKAGDVTKSEVQNTLSYVLGTKTNWADAKSYCGCKIYAKITLGDKTLTTSKVQVVSETTADGLMLTSGKKITINHGGGILDTHAWNIKIPKNAKVTISLTSTATGDWDQPHVLFEDHNDDDYNYRVNAGDKRTIYLDKAGTYRLWVNNVYKEASYSLTITATTFKWGKVTVSGLDKAVIDKNSIPLTIKLTGADSGVKLDGWSCSTDPHNNSGELSGTKATVSLRTTTATFGYQKLYVTLYHDTKGFKKFTFEFPIKPAAVKNCTLSSLFVTNNSVKFNALGDKTNGTKILIQQYKSGKWKTVKSVKPETSSATIKNLKQNTTYKFRLVGYIPASNGKKAITGAATKTLTFKTGYSKKPAVKSVTCTGAKISYVKKQWHSGYWSGGKWYNGFYTGGYYVTTYKIKVTLKSKLSGQLGLRINGDTVAGKGTTFTTTVTKAGKLKGTKATVNIQGYRSNSYIGCTLTVSKTATIK